MFGRLAPGASLASARASAHATGVRLAAEYPEDKECGLTARRLDVGPVDVGPVDRIVPLFTVMLGITVLVLLIACSNVANLLLQRAAVREHEMAVRLALGARPTRIVRQLMTENLLLALISLIVGAAVLAWGRNAFNAVIPASPLPIVADTPVDLPVVLVLATVGVSTIFVFGLAPASRSARVEVRASLSGSGATRGGSAASGRLRGALISAQFALSLAVLVCAGLFLRRLDELQRVDRGFREPEHVVLATVDFEPAGVKGRLTEAALVERMVDGVSALPGVRAAAAATFVPLGFLGYSSMDTRIDGYVPAAGESMDFLVNRVSAGYFSTMGIPIVRGRAIGAEDRDGTRAVAVVNETFARRFWGSADPVGRGIHCLGATATVVGVAGDGKYFFLDSLDAPKRPFIYLPFAQWGYFTVVLHARVDGDPMALVPSIQRAVTDVDGRLSAISPATLDSYTSVPYLPIRLASRVLSVLGTAALLLATIGLYAVTGYAIVQQRREIGIRVALGATPARIVAHFVAHAGRYAGTGALAGLAFAAIIGRGLATQLPDAVPRAVGSWAPPFGLALAVLGVVALLAAFVPAYRAARANPTASLRDE